MCRPQTSVQTSVLRITHPQHKRTCSQGPIGRHRSVTPDWWQSPSIASHTTSSLPPVHALCQLQHLIFAVSSGLSVVTGLAITQVFGARACNNTKLDALRRKLSLVIVQSADLHKPPGSGGVDLCTTSCPVIALNHLEERLLDQAQAQAAYTPLFWGHSRSISQGMIFDVQPLVKSLFCPLRPSPNGFFDSEASIP